MTTFLPLEPRLLLAATPIVSGGTADVPLLTIRGTPEADEIALERSDDQVLIVVNGLQFARRIKNVRQIDIRTGGGDDSVSLRSVRTVNGRPRDFSVEVPSTIQGGGGRDTLVGGASRDNLLGQDSNDLLDGHLGDDTLSGGAGRNDMATYAARTRGVRVSLDDLQNDGEGGESDNVLSTVEHLTGGAGDDTFIGSPRDNTFHGGGGTDHLIGNDGDDILFGDEGEDILDGGDGNDALFALDETAEDLIGGPGENDVAQADTNLGFWLNDAIRGVEKLCSAEFTPNQCI